MSNNEERIYYNNCALTGATLDKVGAGNHEVLKLRFLAYDTGRKQSVTKWVTMFLTSKANERNQETLQVLGVTNVPAEVRPENLTNLNGLGMNAVDLVAEHDGKYENVKFVNKPRYGVRVFDNRE